MTTPFAQLSLATSGTTLHVTEEGPAHSRRLDGAMHAIAVAIVHGPAKGLELGDALKVDAASLIITAWTPFELICWKRHHWIVGPAPEWIVERQNLRPIGIFGTGGFVVNCADSGLQLVYAD